MCLHGTFVPACAQLVTAQQVKSRRARPAPGESGAALHTMVTKETMLHAARRSFRHETQVGQGTASRPRPLAAPVRSHPTRFQIRASLMCLALAQSTAVTTTTASEVVVVGAVVSASIFNGLKHLALPAAVHSTRWWCRRRCGGRVGASVAPHTHPCRRASPRAAVRPFWAARGLPRPVCVYSDYFSRRCVLGMFLLVLCALWDREHVHVFPRTCTHTVVCVSCACAPGQKSLLHPLVR